MEEKIDLGTKIGIYPCSTKDAKYNEAINVTYFQEGKHPSSLF